MKVLIFWITSILILLFWLVAVVDMTLTLGGNESYLKDFPPQLIAWLQDFPFWRKALWAGTVLTGLAGSVLLLLRQPLAPALLWGATILMLLAFVGHDLLLADGARYYGPEGVLTSSILMVVGALFAVYASIASRRRYFSA